MDLTAAERACDVLGIDSVGRGLRLTLASEPALAADTPTLVLEVGADALPRLAVALRERYPDGHSLRLALPEGQVLEIALADLERVPAFTGPAALYVPDLAPEADVRRFRGLVAIIRRLRDPQSGCPWDRAQTHATLKPHLLEEAYETLGALDRDDPAALREELGDLLLQIVLHARIAEQAGEFTTADVVEGIAAKLLRRHPHVFGDATAETADEVAQRWDELKRAEKGGDSESASALGGIPHAMPALAYSQAILGRAERAGFAWPGTDDVLAKVAEEADELAAAPDGDARREELGDLLFVLVSLARSLAIDAEEALRLAAAKFARRFQAMEALASGRGADLNSLLPEALLALWAEAKRAGDTGHPR